ncbi:MAG TPA: electron transfer flavoprotein subunit beta/FixA family protein [Thermoanaerobaculia bacterium]|jgi:electron transfer flavoprotein beta subunit|nr:electron transfer flavoprotein subunit beta/FixA family protein [Thermoanaerobaculia bacterium]
MNSLVCIAYVPDTETKIKIGADGKSIDESDVKWIVSPYDEFGLEEALKTREAKGAGTVTVVAVGPERAKTGLRECLARGADEAIWVDSAGVSALDALGTAKALAAAARGGAYDFFWFGQKGVGVDESLVGPMFAELMGVPHVGSVIKLELGDGKITAHREIEGAHEVVECALPAVLTAQKGLNEPRYASLKGIMAAKKKPIAEKKLAELGVPEADPAHAKTRWRKLELPPARQAAKMIPADDPAAAGRELARLLREDAKVI